MSVTPEAMLDAMLDAYDRAQIAFNYPQLSDNEIAGISYVGQRRTPVLNLTLRSGERFEIRAKKV